MTASDLLFNMQYIHARTPYHCQSASLGRRTAYMTPQGCMRSWCMHLCTSHECDMVQACIQERSLITHGLASTHVVLLLPHVIGQIIMHVYAFCIAQVIMHMCEPCRYSPTLLCVVKAWSDRPLWREREKKKLQCYRQPTSLIAYRRRNEVKLGSVTHKH